MLSQEKKEILSQNDYLNKRKDDRTRARFKLAQNRHFLLGIFLGLLIILSFYFFSSYSDIRSIEVEGNVYLKDEDVIMDSGLSLQDKFLLSFPSMITKRIKKDPLIKDARIVLTNNNLIIITVEEEKIIAYEEEGDSYRLLLENGRYEKLEKERTYLIGKVPLIVGFNEEQAQQIIRGFHDIDHKVINEISEIHRYPFSYDENMMELIMRDGNYIFATYLDLTKLRSYYSIISSIDKSIGKVCLYLDSLTNTGYISSCPWEEVPVTNEEIVAEE